MQERNNFTTSRNQERSREEAMLEATEMWELRTVCRAVQLSSWLQASCGGGLGFHQCRFIFRPTLWTFTAHIVSPLIWRSFVSSRIVQTSSACMLQPERTGVERCACVKRVINEDWIPNREGPSCIMGNVGTRVWRRRRRMHGIKWSTSAVSFLFFYTLSSTSHWTQICSSLNELHR